MANLLLGESIDATTKKPTGPYSLDPADLTTHACIVGMTGSGKTGLGIVLIEECLRNGVSVLAVDPKGDLGNLRLAFPSLEPREFAPWIDAQAAARAGQSLDEAAAAAADAARAGLARAGLGPADVAAYAAGHDAVLYTPGASAGTPLALVASLVAPPAGTPDDELRDAVATVAGGLVSLAGLDPDPVRSKEAVLVGRILETAWRAGRDVTLTDVVQGVLKPPFDRLGALPLDTAFPAKERQALATTLNNLLASPAFAGFLEGEPLDIDRLFPRGPRPRLSIVSIAHLGDAERLFVTALLAERVRAWLRTQPGTSELRALFYLDEVFGFVPPHPANPPPKRPLLTLLKQARAFGVGLVLATQNPVDLDYKGLSNMGTWLVGRLQTEQDQARLAEGLGESVRAQGGDAAKATALLGALEKRLFVAADVHRAGPELLRSRWAMSYLRGPLTRDDLARLRGARAAPVASPAPAVAAARPLPPPWLKERFATVRGAAFGRPHLLVKSAVRYRVEKNVVDEETVVQAYPLAGDATAEVLEGDPLVLDEAALRDAPPADASFDDLPAGLLADRKGVEKAVRDRLPDRLATKLLWDPIAKLLQRPGEAPDAFRARVGTTLATAKAKPLETTLAARRLDLQAGEREVAARKTEKWTAVGTTVLTNLVGFVWGRKRTITGTGSVLTKNRLEDSAAARLEKLRAEVAALEADLAALTAVDASRLEERRLVPSKADVDVLRIELVWVW